MPKIHRRKLAMMALTVSDENRNWSHSNLIIFLTAGRFIRVYGLLKKNLKNRTKSYSFLISTFYDSFSLFVSFEINSYSPWITLEY